jgi:hypothetical protein
MATLSPTQKKAIAIMLVQGRRGCAETLGVRRATLECLYAKGLVSRRRYNQGRNPRVDIYYYLQPMYYDPSTVQLTWADTPPKEET